MICLASVSPLACKLQGGSDICSGHRCQSAGHAVGAHCILAESVTEYKQVSFVYLWSTALKTAVVRKAKHLSTLFKVFSGPLIIPLGVALLYIHIIK